MKETAMLRATTRLLILLPCIAALYGCATVSITSDPPGAEIVCSPTGTPPWQPWPPQAPKPLTTPARKWVHPDPYYFVRVQQNGYYLTTPTFLDVGLGKRQRVHFQLDPTPELFARRQRERGLVLFEGQWVNPKELNLVEYQGRWMRPAEKFKLEQEAKGLIFHKQLGRWMTRQEMEQIEAEEKQAQGLVRFKSQWVTPVEANLQELIDRQAARLAASTATYELRIDRMGPMFNPGAELRITDLSGHPLEILLSGPQSRRSRVPPYNTMAIQTLPGSYTLVVQQSDSRRTGLMAVGKIQMEPQNRYSTTYRGGPTSTSIPLALPAASDLKDESPRIKLSLKPIDTPPMPDRK